MRIPNWYVVLARHQQSGVARELLLRAFNASEALVQADIDLDQSRVLYEGKWRPTHRAVEVRPAFLGEVAEYVYGRPAAQQRALLAELGWSAVGRAESGSLVTYTPVLPQAPVNVTPRPAPTPMPSDGRRGPTKDH